MEDLSLVFDEVEHDSLFHACADLAHSLAHSCFTHSLAHSLIHSLTHSLTRSFAYPRSGGQAKLKEAYQVEDLSLVFDSFSHSLAHSLVLSLARSFIHSLTVSLTRSLTRSLTHSLTHSFTLRWTGETEGSVSSGGPLAGVRRGSAGAPRFRLHRTGFEPRRFLSKVDGFVPQPQDINFRKACLTATQVSPTIFHSCHGSGSIAQVILEPSLDALS